MKLCECGCGQPTTIAKETNSKWGHRAGQPVRFIRGHHARVQQRPADIGQKISAGLFGKPRPSIRGSLNSQWKGGEAKHRRNGRLRWDHQLWKRAVYARDKVCQDCGSGERLKAHHIFPYADFPNERHNIHNGILLCHDCHVRVHRCLQIMEAQAQQHAA
jgi:hypothetical protein